MDKKKRGSLKITSAAVLLIALAVLYVYLYLIPDITGAFTPTVVVNYGKMTSAYDAKAVVVREESVVNADYSGTISYYIAESEKTRIYTKVADVYSDGSKHGMYCKTTGFVSYYNDGYESLLVPDKMNEIDPATYLNLEVDVDDSKAENVKKGSFVYKIVDGSAWYLMIPVSSDQLSQYKVGGNIKIVLDDGTVLNAISSNIFGNETLAVMAKITSYYPDFCKPRTLNVRIITRETEGLQIPISAVTTDESGNPGVLMLGTDNEYHFLRIKVIDEQDGYYLVEEDTFTEETDDGNLKTIATLSLYDEIKRDAGH